MPSIELIAVDQQKPSTLHELPFAVRAESVILSHRVPSIFQDDFTQIKGCIYHLGSSFCDEPGYDGPFFAYELLSARCRDAAPPTFLEFESPFLPALFDLISLLLADSPEGLVIFTTDWQCGPHSPNATGPLPNARFGNVTPAENSASMRSTQFLRTRRSDSEVTPND